MSAGVAVSVPGSTEEVVTWGVRCVNAKGGFTRVLHASKSEKWEGASSPEVSCLVSPYLIITVAVLKVEIAVPVLHKPRDSARENLM